MSRFSKPKRIDLDNPDAVRVVRILPKGGFDKNPVALYIVFAPFSFGHSNWVKVVLHSEHLAGAPGMSERRRPLCNELCSGVSVGST